MQGKWSGIERFETVGEEKMTRLAAGILRACGVGGDSAEFTAHHLVDAHLKGVPSHGVMRLMQYARQLQDGTMTPSGQPERKQNSHGAWVIDGNGGIGIPAFQMGMEQAVADAKAKGIAAIAIVNSGHTGRLGAFAEMAAEAGCMTISFGGGNRQMWRQVAPYGGAKAMLPTNPYTFGIPGGERGPVVLDFATGKIAGGWIYGAKSAGASLPVDSVIDKHGNPTVNPDDYFDGGAILSFGGAKGYGLGLMAELMAEAMLGPTTVECNWLIICIDTARYRDGALYQGIAEEILDDLRTCPPAPGFERVEIPGERERETEARNDGKLVIAEQTWQQILELADSLGVVY